jgi:dihydropteroate synthase
MAAEGADIIDVGGESTRPGSAGTSEREEMRRVIPVISALTRKTDVPISVDTRKSGVADAALEAGASIVNDVSGLNADPDMARTVARHRAGVIVMHMKGSPRTMQLKARYRDLMAEIAGSLEDSIKKAQSAGIAKKDIAVDPGVGFGKTAEHNLEILQRLGELKALGCRICVGTSRKSFIGKVLDIADPAARLPGSLATAVIAMMNGANILRVHDVAATVQAARMTDRILQR